MYISFQTATQTFTIIGVSGLHMQCEHHNISEKCSEGMAGLNVVCWTLGELERLGGVHPLSLIEHTFIFNAF